MKDNTNKKILIVDDNIDSLKILGKLLRFEGYSVSVVQDSLKALSAIKFSQPDLILLDIMMPVMDGFELCQRLKENVNTTKNIPVIFLTARTDEASIEKAYTIGGIDYITKPFKERELLVRINAHLAFVDQKIDLEKRVQEEMERSIKAELQLFEQSKVAAMGYMIGNIAHQWKQPLSSISMVANNIIVDTKLDIVDKEKLNKYSEYIINTTQYLSETIDIFRNFLKEKKEKRDVIIQDRINIALRISEIVLKDNNIEVKNNINYDEPININLVAGELIEVIINIINNAKDILVEKNIDIPWVKLDLYCKKDKVVITIEDNGGGIPENILPNIFDEYFTTKDNEKGTGLGLYMSYEIIVKSLNGKLYAKNTENGAKFFIELPLY